MNKSYMAIGAIALGTGFITMYAGILPHLLTKIAPLTTFLRQGLTQIYTAWTSLPQTVQSIILAGIPTLFAIFFAWTKTRAMQKAQQTQQQAIQLSGEKQAYLDQVTTLQQEKAQLTQQLEANPLSSSLMEAQQLVAQQRQTIAQKTQEITNLERNIATLEGQISILANKKKLVA